MDATPPLASNPVLLCSGSGCDCLRFYCIGLRATACYRRLHFLLFLGTVPCACLPVVALADEQHPTPLPMAMRWVLLIPWEDNSVPTWRASFCPLHSSSPIHSPCLHACVPAPCVAPTLACLLCANGALYSQPESSVDLTFFFLFCVFLALGATSYCLPCHTHPRPSIHPPTINHSPAQPSPVQGHWLQLIIIAGPGYGVRSTEYGAQVQCTLPCARSQFTRQPPTRHRLPSHPLV